MIVRSALVVVALVIAACGESGRGREAASDVTSSETAGRSAAALPAGVRTFVIVPAESKASYVADEELFALALTKFGLPAGWSKVVGSTQAVEGRFQIDTGRPAAWLGDNEFTVRVNTFTTGREMRDTWIKENGPRFNDHPLATFRATAIDSGSAPYRAGEEFAFSLRGTLTIREIAQPATFAVKAQLAGDTLRGSATTRLKMSAFGIETITFYDTLTVADEIGLDVQFTARGE